MPSSAAVRRTLLVLAGVAVIFVVLIGLLTVPGRAWWLPDHQHSQRMFETGTDNRWLRSVATWTGRLTVPTVLRIIALIGAVLLWRRGHREVAAWWVVTMLVGGAVAIAARYAVGRPRPQWPGSGPPVEGFTFPSGHALNASVFAACVLVLTWPVLRAWSRTTVAIACTAFAVAVGLSRVVLGVHFLSDVIAAGLLGLAVVAVLIVLPVGPAVVRRWPAARPGRPPTPSPSPGRPPHRA